VCRGTGTRGSQRVVPHSTSSPGSSSTDSSSRTGLLRQLCRCQGSGLPAWRCDTGGFHTQCQLLWGTGIAWHAVCAGAAACRGCYTCTRACALNHNSDAAREFALISPHNAHLYG
jgi:hypothetical protein